MKLLLFDIDGTLLLTGGAGKVSFNKTFEELFGISDAWQGIRPGGKTDYLIIQELSVLVLGRELNDEEYVRVCVRYLEHFEKDIHESDGFRLMPGIPDLLHHLSGFSVKMGLATGNLEKAAWAKLRRAGLHDFFTFGGFGSDAKHRVGLTQAALDRGLEAVGFDIARSDIYVIGDTIHDIAAGQELGLRTIAVATGSTGLEALQDKDPDHVFQDFSRTDLVLKCLNF